MDFFLEYLEYPQTALLIWLAYRHLTVTTKLENDISWIKKRLENGLDSKLGERGTDLSGGEIQRIGIARSLIYDPEIIFLDEATSSLDTFTEKKILNELKNFDDKTFISVAHRIGTLKNCNKIYLISKGKITDFGNFEKFINY